MKKEFIINQAKFIYTKDELGYQEVLDDFPNANCVTILTYNISEKHTYLLDCLKKISDKTEIKIITNIPNRWKKYYKDNYRDIAKKKIKVYLTKLNPDDIGSRVSVFFCFDNHGKIITTDNIAYIGSSNYSEESKSNIEFGVITRDKQFINYLSNEVIDDIIDKSSPYYEYNYLPLALEANMAISALFSLKNELFDQIYLFRDDIYGSGYYYNMTKDLLNPETLNNILDLMKNTNNIAYEICEAINIITNKNDSVLDTFVMYYEPLIDIYHCYEQIIHTDTIYELAQFNEEDFSCELLENEYGLEAYEDNLENCIAECMSKANEKLYDLCDAAKKDLDNMLKIINDYINKTKELVEFFQEFNLKQINPDIDNTKK